VLPPSRESRWAPALVWANETGVTHDVGGSAIDDPVARDQHAFAPWEVRVDALMRALTDPTRIGGPVMLVDELRRGIESLGPEEYARLGYYEKWLLSMLAILSERGTVDAASVRRRATEIARELRDHDHEETR